MDPTITVICAALLIWLGLGRSSSREDARHSGARPASRDTRRSIAPDNRGASPPATGMLPLTPPGHTT